MQEFDRREAGAAAEAAALAYLQRQGLKLIARNYRCKAGELDLVMFEGRTLVFVEVRYRSTMSFGGAAASVTYRKQRRLINAARHLFMMHADLGRYPARFDVIAVAPCGADLRIEWIRDAFTA